MASATSSAANPADWDTTVTAIVGRRRETRPPPKSAEPQTTDDPSARRTARLLTAAGYHFCREAASDRRSRRAGQLPRARGDAASPRHGYRCGALALQARRTGRADHPRRRVDDQYAADSPLVARRGAVRVRPARDR